MDNNSEEEKKPRRRVKKAKGHGGHHGGAWKVAYADFVTAMMALFLVLWLVSQADIKLKQSIAAYFRSPGVFDTMAGGILAQAKKVSKEPGTLTSTDDEQVLFSVSETLKKKFEDRPQFSKAKDRIKIQITDEGLIIQIIDKAEFVSFPSGSASLTPEAIEILQEISEAICDLPNKINIGGHTDSYVFPSEKGYTNWELSADRANAARRILEAGCVKPEQIHRIVGFADTEPMVPGDPYSPANRRISITVLRLAEPAENDESKPEKKKPADEEKPPTTDLKEKPVSKVKKPEETKPESTDSTDSTDSTEKKQAQNKLKSDGAVVVGEPDKVPEKPKDK